MNGRHWRCAGVTKRKSAYRSAARHERYSRAANWPERTEGRVIRILLQAHNTLLVGTLQQPKILFYVVPDDPRRRS